MITKITSNSLGGVGFEIDETLIFSMFWGPGSYTENYNMGRGGHPKPESGRYSTKTVEIAIWYKNDPDQYYCFEEDSDGNVLLKKFYDVMSYVDVDTAFRVLHKLSEKNAP